MPTEGMLGHGTTLTGAGTISNIVSLDIDGLGVTDDIDMTTMESVNYWKEYLPGLLDAGEISVTLLYAGAVASAIHTAIATRAISAWTVTLPDGSTFICDGYLKSMSKAIPVEGRIEQSVAIKLTGEPAFTEGSSSVA